MSAITAKASRKMKKYAVLTREPRCFLGSFDFSWEQRKLGDIGKARSGVGFPDADQGGVTGVPFFKVSDMNLDGNENEMIVANNYVTAEQIADHRWSPITELPAIFFAKVGAAVMLNRKRLCRFPFLLDNNTMAYSLSPTKWDADFAKALFGTVDLTSLVQVGALPSYNAGDVESMGIYLPSLFEQEQIGAFFKLLDNLITLHQRKCANLCSPSQVVFSLLFATSTFSWEQRKMSDLAEKTYGGGTPTTSNEAYWNGDIPWIQSSDVVDGKLLGVEPRKWITQDGLNNSAAQLISGNSIAIITRVGVGKLAFMPYSYATSQDFLSLSKLNAEPLFTVYACYKKLQSELNAVQGTSIKGITKDELLAKNIMIPRYAEQQQIGAFFKQLDHLITLHQRECISFAGRADWLILTANKKRTTSSWEQRKLGELVDRVVRKNINNESTLPLTISAQYGLVDQITYFNNRVASRDVSNYYLVLNGEFAYNKSTSDGYPFGAVKRLDLYEKGVLSTLYIVFAPKKEQQIDSDYLTVFFDTDRWHKGVAERAAEGARNHGLLNISAEDFFDIDLSVPKDIVEQKQIGAFIRQLDNLITLHQRKPFLMKWRTSDANRNKTNRLVL